ncbi:UPF0481 protein [Spatholobus suberectus]|nr:UPF0481 protein [Spatholobus suberectus]
MTETPPLRLKFSQLEKAKQIPQNSVPKIQRVAHHLRDPKHFTKHYSPRLVSIGPIHYGEPNLQLGEKYKLMWAAMYLERTKQVAQTLHHTIASHIKQLKEQFAEDIIRDFDDEKLSWMLFVDGCSLLQILDKAKLDDPEKMNVKVDQLVLVWQDVLLLENQLPYQVLKLLSGDENDAELLLKSMNKFLQCHHLSPVKPAKKQDKVEVKTNNEEDSALAEEGYTSVYLKNEDTLQPQETPIHLLDQLRRTILHDPCKNNQDHQKKDTRNKKKRSKQDTNEDSDMITYRNIQELRAAGVRLKKSNSRRLNDVSFSCGWLRAELKLPEITVDDTTAPTFLNLIAYEMCPDFRNNYEICSFVAFMDSLIDHPDDVKELRSAGILHNVLGSDEEVAKLFNTISTDLVPDMERYSHVRPQIEKHYRNKCKTWIALGYHTYFSNPWAIIAFHAAVVALVLTFIQTWFAIYPAHAG